MTRAFFYAHFAGEPFFNMAFDEWLLSQALAEPGFVALRLYTWGEGTITFGCNQRKELALDFSKVADTPVIRRVTGGRAIYHDPGELTYAIAADTRHLDNNRLNGSLTQTSQAIARALTSFLRRLGIESQYQRRNSPQDSKPLSLRSAACFDSVARYEIVTGPRKIIASAQRRIRGAFLQHGSIKVHGIVSHPALPLRSYSDSVSSKRHHTITENEFNKLASLFVQIMGASLGLVCEEVGLTEKHLDEIEKRTILVKNKPLLRRDIF
jgi:lipoate-protein ligase A